MIRKLKFAMKSVGEEGRGVFRRFTSRFRLPSSTSKFYVALMACTGTCKSLSCGNFRVSTFRVALECSDSYRQKFESSELGIWNVNESFLLTHRHTHRCCAA